MFIDATDIGSKREVKLPTVTAEAEYRVLFGVLVVAFSVGTVIVSRALCVVGFRMFGLARQVGRRRMSTALRFLRVFAVTR